MSEVVHRAKGPFSDYIIISVTPKLSGMAKKYRHNYRQFNALKVQSNFTPERADSTYGVLEAVYKSDAVYYGKGINSRGAKVLASYIDYANKKATEDWMALLFMFNESWQLEYKKWVIYNLT